MAHASDRLPVTIVAGYLGAGKTTLINRILSANTGKKIAVMVNDFGAINIDARLIRARDGGVTQLANGCICCSIQSDLKAQVRDLIRAPDRPDHLVIETSGVSDPARVAAVLQHPGLKETTRIDAVVTLVDLDNEQGRADPLFGLQVEVADILILNKRDLITDAELADFRSRWTFPALRVLEAVHANVPLDLILGLSAPERDAPNRTAPDHDFWTAPWQPTAPLDYPAFKHAIADLPANVFRAKGFLYLEDLPEEKIIFQQVGSRTEFIKAGPWGDLTPTTELIFIGRGKALEPADLDQLLIPTKAAKPVTPKAAQSARGKAGTKAGALLNS
jgi:G3E family GTPase